jgi:hypothetical protein
MLWHRHAAQYREIFRRSQAAIRGRKKMIFAIYKSYYLEAY